MFFFANKYLNDGVASKELFCEALPEFKLKGA